MSNIQILRFLTAGSVDDGKSTLIGRLLYDCRALPGDTLEFLEKPSNLLPDGSVNLALLTDGLRAEREQGITIDIAHKYFATLKRKFIIADAPGHVGGRADAEAQSDGRVRRPAPQDEREGCCEQDLVEGCGVARDSIAKIDSPG